VLKAFEPDEAEQLPTVVAGAAQVVTEQLAADPAEATFNLL
jgi:hypothetical protein